MFGFLHKRPPEAQPEPDFFRLSPEVWISSDVTSWVEHLFGHKRFNNCFKNINGPRLLTLDEQELLRMGIDKIGPRKKLFREIQMLKTSPTSFRSHRQAKIYEGDSSDDDSGSSYAPGPVQDSTRMIYECDRRSFPEPAKPLHKPIKLSYSGSFVPSELPQVSPPRMPGASSGGSPRSVPASPTHERRMLNATVVAPGSSSSTSHTAPYLGDPRQDPTRWTVAEVAGWLATLNLNEYQGRLIAEKLDGRRLLQLTELDMHNYGIEKIGPRKKLMKAIRELKSFNSSPSDDGDVSRGSDDAI